MFKGEGWVVSTAVGREAMVTYDVTEGEPVENEEEGTKHQTLGDTLGDWGRGGVRFIDANELVVVGEV